jgi:hypothetical protein
MGGAGGYGGAPGGYGGNNQSSGGGKSDPAAEGVVKQFYDKIMAGETSGMADLFSSKAAGKAKAFRDGKATEETVNEMKTLLGTLHLASSRQVQGTRLVLYEENSGGNQAAPSGEESGRGRRKPGKKVQFQLVSEGGKLVIKDIKISDR